MVKINKEKVIPSPEEVEAKTKELKKEKSKTERLLKDIGIFDKTMTQQIEALSMDWGLIKVLYDRIIQSGEEPIFEMITQNGDTYKQINPIWSLYANFRKLQNDTLTKMGMNVYGMKKAEIADEDKSDSIDVAMEINKMLRQDRGF